MNPTALIAEDEPLLAQALQAELRQAWPALQVLGVVADGASAVREALARRPQVLFFDIRMPGLGGLEAAAELADAWDGDVAPFPALVFVTAYDHYAVQAFERQAVDYLLKPVTPERLRQTVARVQQLLAQHNDHEDAVMARLRALLAPAPSHEAPLRFLQVAVGSDIRMVPVDDVLCLEAADKYVRVLTAEREYLVRTPLKDLLPRLDSELFWQVHRGTVVRATAIVAVTRDEAGKQRLHLHGTQERPVVSRLYAHRFKPL
jgi:DNA-binding LytR/AlgR family response regulator